MADIATHPMPDSGVTKKRRAKHGTQARREAIRWSRGEWQARPIVKSSLMDKLIRNVLRDKCDLLNNGRRIHLAKETTAMMCALVEDELLSVFADGQRLLRTSRPPRVQLLARDIRFLLRQDVPALPQKG